MRDLCIIGYAGHAFDVIDTVGRLGRRVVSYLDLEQKSGNPFGLVYEGPDSRENVLSAARALDIFVTVGDSPLRERISERVHGYGVEMPVIIDPDAMVSASVEFGGGSYVGRGAVVNPLTVVGRGCLVNALSVVGHECRLDDYAHVSIGAMISGNVRLGRAAFAGAGCFIRQGVTIGDAAVVGGGAVVLADVPPGQTVVGNPARPLGSGRS